MKTEYGYGERVRKTQKMTYQMMMVVDDQERMAEFELETLLMSNQTKIN